MTIRQTHTYAELEVSAAAYDEIASKLKAADYGHAFMEGGAIDMHGIGITREADPSITLAVTKDITQARVLANTLHVAWADAVRAEWQAFVDADPELKAQHAVALELMREEGYTMEQDPVCGQPGLKPYVAIVDGKEAVCFDWSMTQATPLSAIYTNKVRIVQSAAARVAKALTEEAVKGKTR